jgi:CHAT domain-containing protein
MARKLAADGLAQLEPDDPLYPKLLHVTAMALRLAGDRPDEARGIDSRAARLDRDAWLLSLDPAPQEAALFAREWADWAWSQELWEEAANAYDGAELALARVVLRETPEPSDRLDLLADFAADAPRGAYAYARINRVREAAVLLERAGSLLSRAGEQARAMEQLAASGHADLRDRLRAAASDVSAARAEAPPDTYGLRSPAQLAAQARVDAAVREIRALPGWAAFMTGGGWDDIRRAATTALAYLAATSKGTVMLVVQPGGESISVGCLDPTLEQIGAGVNDFVVQEYGDEPSDSRAALMEALEWLGAHLMIGVLKAVDDRPVVLLPAGFLAFLPLHAAMLRLPGPDPSSTRIHFLFHPRQVSYADSARSLSACRDRADRAALSSALVVNNPLPLPPDLDPLPLADFECAAIGRHFTVAELKGTAATDEAILDALPDAGIAHFSCHGTVAGELRYSSVLQVAGRRYFTAQHLAGLTDLRARLVVLSACRTGAPATGVSQVVSLPNSFITAGANAVISTFWRAEEMATLLLVTKFYDLWQGGSGISPAEALGTAQAWLIGATAAELRSYAPEGALEAMSGRTPLSDAPDQARPYADPWFWALFVLTGA